MIFPMIVGKLVGGFSAVLLAMKLAPVKTVEVPQALHSGQQG
jgi:ethanolamine transporter